MKNLTEEQRWQLVSLGSAVLAAIAVRGALKLGYRAATDEEPPLNPLHQDSSWTDALVFSLATGLTVGLARLGARAVAANVWDEA